MKRMSGPGTSSDVATVPILEGGRWVQSRAKRMGDAFNPSTGQVIARVPLCTGDDVDTAVQAAANALPAWAETPVVERARVMFRFRSLIEANFERMSALVTREHGKTIS